MCDGSSVRMFIFIEHACRLISAVYYVTHVPPSCTAICCIIAHVLTPCLCVYHLFIHMYSGTSSVSVPCVSLTLHHSPHVSLVFVLLHHTHMHTTSLAHPIHAMHVAS